jgi:hypothetical protein
VAHELGGDGGAGGAGAGVAGGLPMAKPGDVGGVGGEAEDGGAVVHQVLVGRIGAVPFQHGELDPVARPALAVSPDAGEGENLLLPRCQQLFHREFGGGVEVAAPCGQGVIHDLDPDGVEVGLIAGGGHQIGRVDLDKPLIGEPCPECCLNAVARQQDGPAVGMGLAVPPCHVWPSRL